MTESNSGRTSDQAARAELVSVSLPVLAVAVVDATSHRRSRLVSTLESGGFHVLGALDAWTDVSGLDPGPQAVVLMADVDFEGDVVGPTAALKEADPDLRVVAVTQRLVSRSVRDAFEAGVDALILERDVDAALALGIRSAYVGQLSIPGEWRQQFGRPTFSPRQKQVLSMVVMGFTNAKIAKTLGVEESTVKSHLFSAFKKLGVRSRKEAAAAILDPRSGIGSGILTIPEAGGLE